MRIVTTTTYDPSRDIEALAAEEAAKLGARYARRGRTSLRKLRAAHPEADVVVFGTNTLEWHPASGGEPFFFHPGMGLIRAKRIAAGARDAMLAACGFEPGDAVVDCTAGLATDSIVFSFAGGPESRVVAVESQLPLYYIVTRGLGAYESEWPPFDEALRRIETVRAEHTAYLRTLADRSVDVVYFDPMFRDPVAASAGISPLRAFANDAPVAEEAIEEARRVARKSVVLKERSHAAEWRRYGFEIVSKPNAPVVYGVIRP
ncbi:class I SAM-dependent methyltransferase [Paenibacillus sp.]|uniref:class I SAM-dependent methyltransferase n=1 Tax=Paenibacillus sp. TaxID=58172 RepID=UPI002D61C300|nr:class I SAM-dependent methyltransferase [Paenibacillus sp.]HZG55230.1 class I SAM-dependent methyltransferase [Paenibacillus sp.]